MENVIKALECRKNADKRCGNPCEDTGLCHYATAARGLDGKIINPFTFICDRERICADAIALLNEKQQEIWELQDQVEYLTDKQKKKFLVDSDGKITPLPDVVLCKDCKYRGNKICPFYQKYQGEKYDDWFCADGERGTDDALEGR